MSGKRINGRRTEEGTRTGKLNETSMRDRWKMKGLGGQKDLEASGGCLKMRGKAARRAMTKETELINLAGEKRLEVVCRRGGEHADRQTTGKCIHNRLEKGSFPFYLPLSSGLPLS